MIRKRYDNSSNIKADILSQFEELVENILKINNIMPNKAALITVELLPKLISKLNDYAVPGANRQGIMGLENPNVNKLPFIWWVSTMDVSDYAIGLLTKFNNGTISKDETEYLKSELASNHVEK